MGQAHLFYSMCYFIEFSFYFFLIMFGSKLNQICDYIRSKNRKGSEWKNNEYEIVWQTVIELMI